MRNMPSHRHFLVAALIGSACAGFAAADVNPHGGMMLFPDISRDTIVFSYANDLWVVSRDGGAATPLASPPGAESFPRFSPDGQTIAFSGNYDGGDDLYTIAVDGGLPTRITHHPAGEALDDWTADGKLLFTSNGMSGLARAPKLFTVGAEGGLPAALPVPYGDAGTISPNGTWLAYTPHNRDARTWKRYRGGMASDVWLFNLNTNQSRRVTDFEGTDTRPMWVGNDTLYYLSDRGESHRLNIWKYELGNSRHTQVTRFSDYDIKWPSIGPGPRGRGEIIFQHGADLMVLDLTNNSTRVVEVTIPGDRPSIRSKSVDVSGNIMGWDISSTAKRAVIEARGDIWTSPADNGIARNLTRTDGVAERSPAWSPDGRWIAYFSDAAGEYELYITQSDGKGETKQLTSDGGPFKFSPSWSPDSKMIFFSDKTGQAYLLTVETGEITNVDRDPWNGGPWNISWSHDSRWITYALPEDANMISSSIWVYNIESGEKTKITSGMFVDGAPTFDRKGDWLYFASARNFSPTYADIDGTYIYNNSNVLLAAPLRKDVKSPWLPESDEETWDKDKKDATDDAGDENADDQAAADEAPAKPDDGVSGTWEGTAQTPDGAQDFTIVLRVSDDGSVSGSMNAGPFSGSLTGNYDQTSGHLTFNVTIPGGPTIAFDLTVKDGVATGTGTTEGTTVDINMSRTAAATEGGDEEGGADQEAREVVEIDFDGLEARAIQLPIPPGNLGGLSVNDKNQLIFVRQGTGATGIKLYDMHADSPAEETVAAGAGGYAMSADGKKLLVIRGSTASIQNASAGAAGKNVKTNGMIAQIDPHDEWVQIFNDAWRIFRDFFYVSNMHGVDWDAVREQYAAMLDDVVTREDLNYVIGEMIAELNVGHAYRGGGDLENEPRIAVGMLGCDFALENGAYRITRIYTGGPWDSDSRGPLSQPGVDVSEGDYLLAVNGIPLESSVDPWAAFIGTAGQVTTLTVSAGPTMDDEAREVLIEPLGGEGGLRYRDWIEHNRKYVEEQTDGQVGYIYVPNTGVDGQNDLYRQFFGQISKKALIIDERWNGGGQIPNRFIELLNRPISNYWARRDGNDWRWPYDSHPGPKCMLINGMAGSGGDMFPWLFKHAGLGKLIGLRTWGGLVGLSGNPAFIDGGAVRVPTFGFYETNGTWAVEGHGTDPDIEVLDDPALMVSGGDPQLDAAIAHMLEEIQRNPYTPPARPAAPDRSGMGILDPDK